MHAFHSRSFTQDKFLTELSIVVRKDYTFVLRYATNLERIINISVIFLEHPSAQSWNMTWHHVSF